MTTVIFISEITVVIDKLVHKSIRISPYYVVRQKKKNIYLHHEPLGIYYQDRECFFQERKKAYVKIAEHYLDKKIERVITASVWIDYKRESCWSIEKKKNNGFYRILSVYFFWTNRYHWHHKEKMNSWFAIGNAYYQEASCDFITFASYFHEGLIDK